MKTYRVQWETDVSADNETEAALKARYQQTRPGTIANVFHVSEVINDSEPIELNFIGIVDFDDESTTPRPIDISGELFEYVQLIARLKTEREMDDDEDGDGMSGDDACEAVSNLIEAARELIEKVDSL